MPTNQRVRTKRKPAEAQDTDHLTISRPEQLQALGDATRWRILGALLEGPMSVQELAQALGRAKGTVGHHVRVLADAGLIRLAETRRVRGVTEKRYARVASRFVLGSQSSADLPPGVDLRLMRTLPLHTALAEARTDDMPDDPSMSLVIRARMPIDRARRFARLLEHLADEFAAGAPGEGETFGLVAGIYVPDWARAPKAG